MKHLSLTWRLLLFSLLFFLLPVLSWILLHKFDQSIEQQLEKDVVSTSKHLALWFEQVAGTEQHLARLFSQSEESSGFPVAIVQTAILIDGYADEWYPYREKTKTIRSFGQQAKLTIAEDSNYLYGIFEIEDNTVVYRRNQDGTDLSDKIQLTTGPYHIQFRPLAPGQTPALRQSRQGLKAIPSIYAQWQENSNGYTLEFRMPQSLVGDSILAEVHDVDLDNNTNQLQGIMSFTNFEQLELDSQLKQGFLHKLSDYPMLVSLVDLQGNVKFQFGSLQPEISNNGLSTLWLSKEMELDFSLKDVSQLAKQLVVQLNQNQEADLSLNSGEVFAHQLALSPLVVNKQLIGGVIVEKGALAEKMMLREYWLYCVICLALIWCCYIFLMIKNSRQVSRRIRLLRDLAESSVTESGQLLGVVEQDTNFNDEVADLTNSFSYLTSRLQQYQDYQDKFIARLNHELRTPIAIVRSSLDNLNHDNLQNDDQRLLLSAQSGAKRLSQTLSRLSEANRLEQSIFQVTRQEFEVLALLKQVVKSYQLNWPQNTFTLDSNLSEVLLWGSKELFVQMIDKIVSNAVDFSEQEKPIQISLNKDNQGLTLAISNQGPSIDKSKLKDVFNILQSTRKGEEGHLGLGLYMAKLIAQFHKAKIYVKNTSQPQGVSFIIYWKNNCFTHK